MKIGFRILLAGTLAVSSCGPAYDAPHFSRRVEVAAATAPDKPALKLGKKGRYYVRKPWTVELHGQRWVVPRGYYSNGITAPPRVKQALGDGVEHPETWAAVFHDWLFTQPEMTRARADGLFLELLLAYGVPPKKAHLMAAAVSTYSFSKKFR